MWFHAHAHDLPLAAYLELSFWQTHADQRASEFQHAHARCVSRIGRCQDEHCPTKVEEGG